MKKSIEFLGVYPALMVGFLPDASLDLEGIKTNVRFLMEQGCAGMVCNGSTGEAGALSREERVQVIKATREAMGGKGTIIAGAGTPYTASTLTLVKDAIEAGADAALVLSPIGNTTDEGVVRHYEEVAKLGLPIVLYNHPIATGISITMELFDRLIQIPNIIGMKESSGNMPLLAEIQRKYKDSNLSMFSGSDDLILPSFAVGLKATILATANVAPKHVVDILKYVQAGKMAEAQDLYCKMAPLTKLLGDEANFPASIKKAVELLGRPSSDARLPILPYGKAETAEMKEALKIAGLL